jgi:hypothetical protein
VKKTILFVALIVSVLVVSTAQLFAQAASPVTTPTTLFLDKQKPSDLAAKVVDPPVTFNFDLSSRWNSSYVGSFDKLCTKNPVVQTDLMIQMKIKDVPGKFYFDVWNSVDSVGSMNSSPGDELDFTLGWKGEVYKGINLNLWVTYLDFVPIGDMPTGKDQVRFFVEVDRKWDFETKSLFGDEKTTSSIDPFIRFEVSWGLQGYKVKSGLRVYPGVKTNWEFAPSWSVFNKFNFVLDNGACGLDRGVFVDEKVGISWKICKGITIEPISFRVIKPLTAVDDGRKANTIVGTGIVFSF